MSRVRGGPFDVAHYQQSSSGRCAKNFLADGVIWIWHQHGQWIGEHGRCFIEEDLMLVQIGFRLAHIPFELVAHGSTLRLSRADANKWG